MGADDARAQPPRSRSRSHCPCSRPALAHGFGPTYDIPIPLWLYLYGAAAAVLLAFVTAGPVLPKAPDAAYQYPAFRPVSRPAAEDAPDLASAHGWPAFASVALFLSS